jgi:hypothetical protein
MSDDAVKNLHYKRQFLAPEGNRWDEYACISYVRIDEDGIEAELTISSGRDAGVNFDRSYRDEGYDDHLAIITALMEQIIAYRQAYAEAIAIVRGQATTRGGYVVEMTVDGSKTSEE